MSERTRKERSDKKPPGQKMTRHLTVKLKPASRMELAKQAARAGFKSTAEYLRDLAEKDRPRLALPGYCYNEREG